MIISHLIGVFGVRVVFTHQKCSGQTAEVARLDIQSLANTVEIYLVTQIVSI